MKFQKGCFVKLKDTFLGRDFDESPIWGGPCGFIGGTVTKTFTHTHDATTHEAEVEWYNGKIGRFKDGELTNLTDDESRFSRDQIACKGLLDKDIFILVKTASGRYSLNVIESVGSFSSNLPRPDEPKYTTLATRHALITADATDMVLVAKTLSFPDLVQRKAVGLFGAYAHWFNTWSIAVPRSVYHPLPQFKSLKEAAEASPKDVKGAYAFFHLPLNLCDYSAVTP